jgi:DNA-binding NarL/FixJ family response regulator
VDEKTVLTLVAKLDAIIKLMVLGMTEGKPQVEKIALLSSVGFPPKQIAQVLGTTPNTVRVVLSALRKKASLRRKAPTEREV